MIKLFLLSRALDIITTVYSVSNGADELNPFMKFLLDNGTPYFLVYQALVILLVLYLYPKSKLMRIAVNIFTVISLLIGLSNLFVVVMVFLFQKGVI